MYWRNRAYGRKVNRRYHSKVDRVPGYLARLHWRWVLLAGVGAAVLPYLLSRLAVYAYLFVPLYLDRGTPSGGQIRAFGDLILVWGWPALYLLLTVLAASWVARRAGERAVLHGVAVGIISVVASQIIGLYYGPLDPGELVKFLLLGIGGGLAGGYEGRAALAGQQALYRASREIAAAGEGRDLVAALGKHLAGPEVVGVALWRSEGEHYEFVDSWPPQPSSPEEEVFESLPSPKLAGDLETEPYVKLRKEDLSAEERLRWQGRGIRSVVLLGLFAPGGEKVGLVGVISRKREGLSRGSLRRYLTATAQVALALRLMEQGSRVGVLRERQRLAHEIHDTLAQGFASIVMNLEAAEGALQHGPDGTQQYLEGARLTARENLTEARRLVWAMKPGPLEEASLSEALNRIVERWSRENGASAGCEVVGEPRELSQKGEATILRVAQEALSNAGKHARAGRVMVTLSYMKSSVILDVSDDGEGFDPQAPVSSGSGFGLGAMRERVEGEGGTLSTESEPGKGTTLVAELPLAPNTNGSKIQGTQLQKEDGNDYRREL